MPLTEATPVAGRLVVQITQAIGTSRVGVQYVIDLDRITMPICFSLLSWNLQVNLFILRHKEFKAFLNSGAIKLPINRNTGMHHHLVHKVSK